MKKNNPLADLIRLAITWKKVKSVIKKTIYILVLVGDILVLVGVALAAAAFSTWLFQTLFNFVAPVFWEDAPTLTFWQALATIGILSIIGNFFKSPSKSRK